MSVESALLEWNSSRPVGSDGGASFPPAMARLSPRWSIRPQGLLTWVLRGAGFSLTHDRSGAGETGDRSRKAALDSMERSRTGGVAGVILSRGVAVRHGVGQIRSFRWLVSQCLHRARYRPFRPGIELRATRCPVGEFWRFCASWPWPACSLERSRSGCGPE
jgi:hypothetical protein